MKRLSIILIGIGAVLLTSCSQCDSDPVLETRTFDLQLVTGDTITETFELPVGTEVSVQTTRGGYYLEAENYHCCMYDNILTGVVYIIDER